MKITPLGAASKPCGDDDGGDDGGASSSSSAGSSTKNDCTRSYIRALTVPLLTPPSSASELEAALSSPWNVRMPVDADDDSTRVHWQEQRRTAMFERMFDWGPSQSSSSSSSSSAVSAAPVVSSPVSNGNGVHEHKAAPPPAEASCVLHPHFSFGSPSSPFFAPWEDVGHCLRSLLLHRIGARQTSASLALVSHDTDIFLSTAWNFDEDMMEGVHIVTDRYYLLRCHHDRSRRRLIFGYHRREGDGRVSLLRTIRSISLEDENWRLETCVVLKNLARILNCLKDYAVPFVCNSEKLSLVDGGRQVQKVYRNDRICSVFDASVENMIGMYDAIAVADVPHTDKLVHVERRHDDGRGNNTVVCRFAPVGRSYLPLDAGELLDALVCVAEALVVLHSVDIMHRDIRWANVFHAFRQRHNGSNGEHEHEHRHRGLDEFSREWVLFDFEFAARSPQPPLGEHTLTPGNHAPEMIIHHDNDDAVPQPHTTAVDIWGLGYLIEHCEIDLPASHAAGLIELRDRCMDPNPDQRPGAEHCLDVLTKMRSRPRSTEKNVAYWRSLE